MVRKLMILGIDGMDWDVIVRYKDKLQIGRAHV